MSSIMRVTFRRGEQTRITFAKTPLKLATEPGTNCRLVDSDGVVLATALGERWLDNQPDTMLWDSIELLSQVKLYVDDADHSI